MIPVLRAALATAVAVLAACAPAQGRSTAAIAPGNEARFVPLVGRWSASPTDGSPMTADGAGWDGRQDPAAVRDAGIALFGVADSTFIANGVSAAAFPVAVHASTMAFASGSIRVDFSLIAGASDQFAGVVFGLTPRGEYVAARYNTKDGNLAIWSFANGARQVLAKGDVKKQLPLNTWHTLDVTIRGREVRATLRGDSTMMVSHQLEQAPTGRVGLWTKRDAVTAFRNFTATR